MAPQRLCVALYSNVDVDSVELRFQKGDVMEIKAKSWNNSPDWWCCTLDGKVGCVPANYVKAID